MEIKEMTAADYAELIHAMRKYRGTSWCIGSPVTLKSLAASRAKNPQSEKPRREKPKSGEGKPQAPNSNK